MSKIQINNLQAAGSELFQSSESFLTELQATEAHAVYGGKSKNKSNKRSGKSSKRSGRSSRRGSSGNSGRNSFVFVPVPFPFPVRPYHC